MHCVLLYKSVSSVGDHSFQISLPKPPNHHSMQEHLLGYLFHLYHILRMLDAHEFSSAYLFTRPLSHRLARRHILVA